MKTLSILTLSLLLLAAPGRAQKQPPPLGDTLTALSRTRIPRRAVSAADRAEVRALLAAFHKSPPGPARTRTLLIGLTVRAHAIYQTSGAGRGGKAENDALRTALERETESRAPSAETQRLAQSLASRGGASATPQYSKATKAAKAAASKAGEVIDEAADSAKDAAKAAATTTSDALSTLSGATKAVADWLRS